MILALRESRSARRESRSALRDSRRAWNATRLVTYFWAVLYLICDTEIINSQEGKK